MIGPVAVGVPETRQVPAPYRDSRLFLQLIRRYLGFYERKATLGCICISPGEDSYAT